MILEHLLFPSLCPACELPSSSLCGHCQGQVSNHLGGGCSRCGATRPAECLCAVLPAQVERVFSLWRFEGPILDVIEAAKYRGEIWRIQVLEPMIRHWFGGIRQILPRRVHVAPVPTSRKRLARRGFDLPSVLARWFERESGVSLQRWMLKRQGEGKHQAGLDRASRMKEVEHVFSAGSCPPDVILVDDVITTGATAIACSRALAVGGAKHITVVSLARTPMLAS